MRNLTIILSLLAAMVLGVAAHSKTELVMVEEVGCVWCARWDAEISEAYPKTAEGKAAPLRRIDIHAKRPDDLTFARRLAYTPTFVLVVDGVEAERLEGYPGEDFFWHLLGKMMGRAGIEFETGG